MFTLGYGEDGRVEAAAEIKKALTSKPFRRDTIEKLSGRDDSAGLTRDAALGMFRKASKAGRRLSHAEMQAIGKALKKGLPPQSSNARNDNDMADTGAGNVRTSQYGVNDKVPKPDNGAGVDTIEAMKSIHAAGPKRMFDR